MRLTVLCLILIIAFTSYASSQGILGVSPGHYRYEDVLRGGYAERYFTISYSGEEPVEITIEPMGEIASWINLSTNFSIISKDNPLRIIAAVEPPSDTPNGNYSGILRLRTTQVNQRAAPGRATGNVIGAIEVSLGTGVTDHEIIRCHATNFMANSAEKGDDLEFRLNFANTGNIRLRPRVRVDLWDQEQISIVKSMEYRGQEILPTRQDNLFFSMPTDDLELGQYWIDIHALDCLESQLLTADVLEPGALKAQGTFKDILASPIVPVKETTRIIAVFENEGEKAVDAQFRGQITLNNKIVQVLESEKISVRIGEISNFTFFFTPTKPGDYIIDGRFFYDKKRTFEASKLMQVERIGLSLRGVLTFLVYALIAAGCVYLYMKIRKEIKKHGGLR